jgi:prephenate dehydratase
LAGETTSEPDIGDAKAKAGKMAKGRGSARARRGDAANTIAFQGEAGANSDMACRAAFPYMTTLPCPTFETAMGAVQAGKAEFAMIPVENSIAGRVADLHSLLPHTRLKIVAEHFQRVEHCLVALPGATLKTVKTVKSHVQALSQCRNFLKKHRFQPLVHADTAGAAREIAEDGDPQVGAIASSLAARIYELKVLARNIEDADHNTTRMLVFSRDEAATDWRTVQCMTAFLFRVKSVPAALYKALGGFATNGINIVKLESYLSGAHFEQAQFYAEVEGHPEQRSLRLALEELGFFSEEFKALGTFPAHPFRRRGWQAPTRPGT